MRQARAKVTASMQPEPLQRNLSTVISMKFRSHGGQQSKRNYAFGCYLRQNGGNKATTNMQPESMHNRPLQSQISKCLPRLKACKWTLSARSAVRPAGSQVPVHMPAICPGSISKKQPCRNFQIHAQPEIRQTRHTSVWSCVGTFRPDFQCQNSKLPRVAREEHKL